MDPSLYTYPSPLEGLEHLPPISMDTVKHGNGNALINEQTGVLSKAYDRFVDPIHNDDRGGFDVHVYYFQNNPEQTAFAKALWERIRREFPELRIYQIRQGPIGPHTVAMFEVNLFTPQQFGAFVSWLVINRGPLNALVHPNTDMEERDHTQRATWMGEQMPLDLSLFKKMTGEQARKRLLG